MKTKINNKEWIKQQYEHLQYNIKSIPFSFKDLIGKTIFKCKLDNSKTKLEIHTDDGLYVVSVVELVFKHRVFSVTADIFVNSIFEKSKVIDVQEGKCDLSVSDLSPLFSNLSKTITLKLTPPKILTNIDKDNPFINYEGVESPFKDYSVDIKIKGMVTPKVGRIDNNSNIDFADKYFLQKEKFEKSKVDIDNIDFLSAKMDLECLYNFIKQQNHPDTEAAINCLFILEEKINKAFDMCSNCLPAQNF